MPASASLCPCVLPLPPAAFIRSCQDTCVLLLQTAVAVCSGLLVRLGAAAPSRMVIGYGHLLNLCFET